MTRRKVPLQFINSDASRKITFKKRKKGLIKKVSELSTLCGIDACAIIYSPFSSEPEVWPSPAGARRVIARFRNLSEMDRSRGMVNQQGFLRQRIGKAELQLKKQQRDNHDKEVADVMFYTLTAQPTALIGMNASDLNEINSSAGKTLHDVEDRIKLLKKNPSLLQQLPQLGNVSFEPHDQQASFDEGGIRVPDQGIQMELGQGDGFNFDQTMMMEQQQQQQQQQQWFMDLLRPTTDIFGNAGEGGGGLGFGNEVEVEANITNGMMMMHMPSSSSSSMPMGMPMQMPNNNPNNNIASSSSSWPNFLYP